MSLQAIEAASKYRHPAVPTDLRRGETTAAPSAVRRGVSSQRKQASTVLVYRQPSSTTFEGLRRSTRIAAYAFAAAAGIAGVCILSLVIDAPGENGPYRESNSRSTAVVAPIAGRDTNNVLTDRPPLVSRAEFDALRSTAEAASVKQQQALDQQRARADALARELASLQAELEAVRTVDSEEAVQAAAALIAQMRALDQERARADALARELGSVRNELEASNRRIASPDAPVANARSVLNAPKPAVDGSPERIAEPSPIMIEEKHRAPKQTPADAIAFSPEHSTIPELPHPSALAAREAIPGLKPKVAMGTDRPTTASAVLRSPKHRLRMHRSSKSTLAGLTRCPNVLARELPSCRPGASTRTYSNRDVRRLAASTTRTSGPKPQNGDQLVANDSSKGATQ